MLIIISGSCFTTISCERCHRTPFSRHSFIASPFSISPVLHSASGSPMLMELRRKILSKDFATTPLIPAYFIAIEASSLEEPQPKFSPATIKFPALRLRKSGSRSSMQCCANTLGSVSANL